MPEKARRSKGTGKATRKILSGKAAKNRQAAAVRVPPPRKDKEEGESAVQARIAALDEPSHSIMARFHPIIMKHGKELQPTVKWGFAVYMRDGKMVLVAAPRKNYVSFGYTQVSGIKAEPIEFSSVDQVDEARVATLLQRLVG
jgi:hypothetical protein